MAAVLTTFVTGDPIVDGLLSGSKWASPNVTFSFPTSASQYPTGETEAATFQPLTALMHAAAYKVLGNFSAVSGLVFTEDAASPGTATIRMGFSEAAAPTSYAYYPSDDALGVGGDVWFSRAQAFTPNAFDSPVAGNYAWQTMMHELGHAVGLKHSQEASGLFPAMPVAYDSQEYTVMSYRSYEGSPLTGYSNANDSFAQSLMIGDIKALQSMYGANWSTNSSDTVYQFNSATGEMSINGVGQGGHDGNKIFQTIWDGGGNDTYDFSNFTADQTINLDAGNYSAFSPAQLADLGNGHVAHGNVYNALQYNSDARSLIENATGGSGNDSIAGNQTDNVLKGNAGADILIGLGGADTLDGGSANDTIDGGADVDTAVFHGQSSTYTVTTVNGVTTVSGADGVDTLQNVEFLRFDDQTITTPGAAVVIDTIPPQLLSATPGKASAGVKAGADIVLTFDEVVTAGTGAIVIHNADGSVWRAISVTDTSQVTVSGATVKIDPGADLNPASHYYVTVDAGAVVDLHGNAFAGLTGATDFSFDTAAPPVPIVGNALANILNGTAGDDVLRGLGGNDTLNGNAGNDLLDGGVGADRMTGGLGDDTYIVDNAADAVVENFLGGADSVRTSLLAYTLGLNVENLTFTGSGAFTGTGNDAGNIILGGGGNDILAGNGGNDQISGGAGNDLLRGGAGADILEGGVGADKFVFASVLETTAGNRHDVILDFKGGADKIDLSAIDADSRAYGNQAFHFIGGNDFTGVRGELHVVNGVVSGDINGDRVADFEIQLANAAPVTAADFVL